MNLIFGKNSRKLYMKITGTPPQSLVIPAYLRATHRQAGVTVIFVILYRILTPRPLLLSGEAFFSSLVKNA
ncbi:MAG: hypothetical protein U9P80_03840, partial [Thermodesulfobacteriota bacterium]|nr:hypothetical protein [Thermodesulfobacteriota bacterium]